MFYFIAKSVDKKSDHFAVFWTNQIAANSMGKFKEPISVRIAKTAQK